MRTDMTEKTKAVIFDMDGTLIDSMWIWPDIDAYYVKKYHLELPDDFHRAIEGKSYHETAQYFRDTFDMALSTEEIMDEWTSLAYQRYLFYGHADFRGGKRWKAVSGYLPQGG